MQVEPRIGRRGQQFLVMGDEQDDGAAPGAVPDGPRDRLQVPPVHTRTGLVVDDDARTRAPGGGDDEALLLPARQRQRMLLGVGQGLVVSPNQTLSLVDVPLEYAGAAGGILQTGERIGTSIGIAAITGLTFRVSHSSGWDVAAQAGLLAVVAAISVSAAVAAVDLRLAARRRR